MRNLPDRAPLLCECPLTGSAEIVCRSNAPSCSIPETPQRYPSQLRYSNGKHHCNAVRVMKN